MSMRKFKKLCIEHGYDPAVATKLRQQCRNGATKSVEEFTPQWVEFTNTHSTWNCVFQLACKVGFSFT